MFFSLVTVAALGLPIHFLFPHPKAKSLRKHVLILTQNDSSLSECESLGTQPTTPKEIQATYYTINAVLHW